MLQSNVGVVQSEAQRRDLNEEVEAGANVLKAGDSR